MPVIISLLRAVNVGGHNTIKMDALRALYESLGLRRVQTYVQSGNVVFQAQEQSLVRLQIKIEDAIEKKAGFRPTVVLRTIPEWKQAMAANPFARKPGADTRRLLVMFLAGEPAKDAAKRFSELRTAGEELKLAGRELHLYCPRGVGQVKFWTALDKILQTPGTGRNWNTVVKLLALAQGLASTG